MTPTEQKIADLRAMLLRVGIEVNRKNRVFYDTVEIEVEVIERADDAWATFVVGRQRYPHKIRTERDLEQALKWVSVWKIEQF